MALEPNVEKKNRSKKYVIGMLLATVIGSTSALGNTASAQPLPTTVNLYESSLSIHPSENVIAEKSPSEPQRKSRQPIKKTAKRHVNDMSWVKMQQRFPGAFVTNGPRNKKMIALTFDDAPDPRFTPAILDVLAKYDVCATFFVVGNRAAKHPELVKRINREGHMIGNHSYNHAVMSLLSNEDFRSQIGRTDTIVSRIIGYHPRFIRPPYGEMLPAQIAWTKRTGYIVVNWDVDSVDWKNNPSSNSVLLNIKKTLQPGSIILQHAGGGVGQDLSGTINALPQLIVQLRQKGYELVTLSEMLGQAAAKTK